MREAVLKLSKSIHKAKIRKGFILDTEFVIGKLREREREMLDSGRYLQYMINHQILKNQLHFLKE